MTPRRGPTKRLLIAPAALFAALVTGLYALEAATSGAPDPALVVSEALPPVAGDEQLSCGRRGGDAAPPEQARVQPGGLGRVTSEQVLACPAVYDGLRITYVGELVGDLLMRDGGAWVLVNDDAYALEVGPLPSHGEHRGTNTGLTVWLPEDLLSDASGLGRPNQRGDVAEVSGRIVRADPADGGGLTLRADAMRIIAPATGLDDPLDARQAALALGAVIVAGVLVVVRRRSSRG